MIQRSNISLYKHQRDIIDSLKTGSILCGGVGTGKTITSLSYYYIKECGGTIGKTLIDITPMTTPKNLYVITTARKRDTLEWDKECLYFGISRDSELNQGNIKVTIDSWNNIGKYTDVKDAFFILDEQRLVGYGAWVKSFLSITKNNNWVLLSATPGDTWSDYIPILIANGKYKNKTEFSREHIVYKPYMSYPVIDRYINTAVLERYREEIVVMMHYQKHTKQNHIFKKVKFNVESMNKVFKDRWNIYTEEPIKGVSELCHTMRQITNTDPTRILMVEQLITKTPKVIIFYNFNYELDILRDTCTRLSVPYSEWNGQKHEAIPSTTEWVYLVQYTAGAEGWNCVETDTIIFYSQNYSYKVMIQAAGRIDRLNSPFTDLYYYHLRSESNIDKAIGRSLSQKKNFNERIYL